MRKIWKSDNTNKTNLHKVSEFKYLGRKWLLKDGSLKLEVIRDQMNLYLTKYNVKIITGRTYYNKNPDHVSCNRTAVI